MYRNLEGKNEEVDEFELTLQFSQDSLPLILNGMNTAANLVLLYNFSTNECSGKTPLNSLSSSGKY